MSDTNHDDLSAAVVHGSGWLGRLHGLATLVASLAITAIGLYVFANVLLRNTIGVAMPDEAIIVAELMIFALALPLGAVAATNAFVAVDLIAEHLPRMVQWVLAVVSTLFALVIVAIVTWSAFGFTTKSIREQSYFFGLLDLPEWPGQLAFTVGYALLLIQLAVNLVRIIRKGNT
jgi:TRAP-type C4-dicarboxylate transport system permease small subunit